MGKRIIISTLILLCFSVEALSNDPPAPGRGPVVRPLPGGPLSAEKPKEIDWAQADIVFYGKLTEVNAGPVATSYPPIHNHRLTFTVEQTLRGDLEEGGQLTGHHSARQVEAPTFPEGDKCLVAAAFVRGGYQIKGVEKADADAVKQMFARLSLPLGWKTTEDGKPVSPWPAGSISEGTRFSGIGKTLLCSVSGRPAFFAGKAQVSASPVPPAKDIKWTNPDGDGEYTITVTNPNQDTIEIPALLTDGKDVLWNECLVIQCQKKAYPIPGAKPLSGDLKPVILRPGEKISTVVNALSLVGPEWPRGGYRIEFQFCLGEKSARQSFYYMSRHHDALREKAQGGK